MTRNESPPPRTPRDPTSPASPTPAAASSSEPAGADLAAADLPDTEEPQDPVLERLGKRFRGPIVRTAFALRCTATRHVYRRDFAFVSQMLWAIESSPRVPGLPRATRDEALESIALECHRAREALLGLASDMREFVAASGHARTPIEFVRPRVIHATIVSHYARDYIAVLELADDVFTQIQRAWLLGLLEPVERRQRAAHCHRALRLLKQHMHTQRSRIGALVREINSAPQADEDAPAGSGSDHEPVPMDVGDIAFAPPDDDFQDTTPPEDDAPARVDRPPAIEEPPPAWPRLSPHGLVVPWFTGSPLEAG